MYVKHFNSSTEAISVHDSNGMDISLVILVSGISFVVLLFIISFVMHHFKLRLVCECEGTVISGETSDGVGGEGSNETISPKQTSGSKCCPFTIVTQSSENSIFIPSAKRIGFNDSKGSASCICRKFNDSKSLNEDCPICLEPYKENEELIILTCKHGYHESCLYSWVKIREVTVCPLCKGVSPAVTLEVMDRRKPSVYETEIVNISSTHYGPVFVV